jgi:hypothetical protein
VTAPLTPEEIRFLVDRVDPEFTRQNNRLSLANAGGFCERCFGEAIAFQDVKKPKSAYYNRVVGFGEPEIPLLPEIESIYKDNNLTCTVSLPPHRQSAELVESLSSRGFRFDHSDYVFFLRPEEYQLAEDASELEVSLVTTRSIDLLFKLMSDGGANVDPSVTPLLREDYCRPPFQFYVARVDGVPAARASVFFFEGVAWLNNAVTLDSYRGRGCHNALLTARISAAIEHGSSVVVSDTEFGSASHRNLARHGFQIGFTTAEFKASRD